MFGATISLNEQSLHKPTRDEDLDLPIFDFGIIAAGTDNFAAVNKLGDGGFGPVYKVNIFYFNRVTHW